MSPIASPAPLPSSRSWRNRRGFVSALVVGVVLFALAGVAAFAAGLMTMMKSSAAYRQALGTPVEDAWYFTGSIQTRNGAGEADLEIPLSGPRGSARLHAQGRGRGGDWTFPVLQARLDADGRVLDLRPMAAGRADSAPPAPAQPRKTGDNRKGE